MKSKKILLALSSVHGISELIEENLQYYGFDVTNISRNDKDTDQFRYPSFYAHLQVKIRKLLFRDKNAKQELQSKLLLDELKYISSNIDKFDYSLFILAQCYSLTFLDYVKEKTKNGVMVNYQWDGMDRFPSILERIHYFDRFFAFDPQDIKKYHVLPTTSFYFDFDLKKLPIEYDFYYLGAHRDDRSGILISFANFAKSMGWTVNINIALPVRRNNVAKLYPENINLLKPNEVKDFKENLLASRKSKVLLDFVISEHNGLSLRTFEALGHDKKLITTNKEIIKYDFYHPNNIFILDNNFDDIPEFLDKPYHHIEPKIKEKYSFGNWIKYVLNIEPHQPILLPQE